jgi:hypothetical protein
MSSIEMIGKFELCERSLADQLLKVQGLPALNASWFGQTRPGNVRFRQELLPWWQASIAVAWALLDVPYHGSRTASLLPIRLRRVVLPV